MEQTLKSLMTKIDERKNLQAAEEENGDLGITLSTGKTNVIPEEVLRKVQIHTLNTVKDILANTFGPMGSNTKLIDGIEKEGVRTFYSKDGLKVLKNVRSTGPLEHSIIKELVDVTSAVEKEVGDGTTSTVILSALIFDQLADIQKEYNVPPFTLIRMFESVVDTIKKIIESNKKDVTLDDIYHIAMISTNGNEEVATNIRNIYDQFGMDVELSVGVSNDTDHKIVTYDGLTITEGYSSSSMINNASNNEATIKNAHIYHFRDPIDDDLMAGYMRSIINHNIFEPLQNRERYIPTVITAPKISTDISSVLKDIDELLYQFTPDMYDKKPPLLIIDNVIASDEVIMDDIANLCGCKSIQKYIDPKVLKADQENGNAPTMENVYEWAGHAEMVVAYSGSTKFINPANMKTTNADGEEVYSPQYTALLNMLETELADQRKNNAHDGVIGLLLKRISAMKANLVNYLIGGATIADRDATKDLVEDAIKNCKSASMYGYGYAANFEGLRASKTYYEELMDQENVSTDDLVRKAVARSIYTAYIQIAQILYGTVESDPEKINEAIANSLEVGSPINISSGVLDTDNHTGVLCSIKLDQNILDTFSKIITVMATCNQALLQVPELNVYN